MQTLSVIFFVLLPMWIVFALAGRVGIRGWRRYLWCAVSGIPILGLVALIRLTFFPWPIDTQTLVVEDSSPGLAESDPA
jgi:hypothetical protein